MGFMFSLKQIYGVKPQIFHSLLAHLDLFCYLCSNDTAHCGVNGNDSYTEVSLTWYRSCISTYSYDGAD